MSSKPASDSPVPVTGTGDRVPRLEARGLTKAFVGVRALRGIDVTVAPGAIHGIVGANGSGKSTFVKVLAGYHQADSGTILVNGEEIDLAREHGHGGFRFVHQDLGLIPALSVTENLRLVSQGTDRGSALRPTRLGREVATAQRWLDEFGLEIDAKAPVASLSPSQRTMVAVVRALGGEPEGIDLLVLDEVTATLPPNEVAELFTSIRKLPRAGGSVLFVSHHLQEVLELCDHVSVFRDGEIVGELETEATDDRRLIELITGQPIKEIIGEQPNPAGGRPVLSVEDLDARGLFDLGFEIHEGEIVGLASIDPFLPSRLLRTLYGLERRGAGKVELNGTVIPPGEGPTEVSRRGISLVANRLDAGVAEFNVRENLTLNELGSLVRRCMLSGRAERAAATGLVERFGIRPANPEALFSTLSGGNQQKAVLAKSMRLEPALLLLDDPTQGVDIGAKRALHEVVRQAAERGLAVLVNSTDHEELCAICHRVLTIRNGRINNVLHAGELTPANILDSCYRSADGAAVAEGRLR